MEVEVYDKFLLLRSRRHVVVPLVVTTVALSAPVRAQPTLAPVVEAAQDPLAERNPHYLRAAIEMALAVGAGTAWYWIDRERQVADWDYPSWEQRLTLEAWRFDNNPFGINYVWHGIDGAAYHVLARANDLSLVASVGYGFATSMVWEYFFEFREKVSINDVIVTPGAGLAIGEFFHWLGRYTEGRSEVARWTAGLAFAAHDQLDGVHRRARRDIWHQFRVAYGLGRAEAERQSPPDEGADSDAGAVHRLELDGRLVALDGYLAPGRRARWFRDANVTRLAIELTTDTEDTGVDFRADTMLVGRQWQAIGDDGSGWSALLGASIAYDYRRETVGIWTDRLALLHLPGPGVDAYARGSTWSLHGSARLSADFAGIHALAHDRWIEAHPNETGKTILRKQGYYYGWGASTRAELELELPHLVLGGALSYGRYWSQEGLDRSQEDLTVDISLSDTALDVDAWLRAAPLTHGVFVEARWSHQRRRARQHDLRDGQELNRLFFGIGVTF